MAIEVVEMTKSDVYGERNQAVYEKEVSLSDVGTSDIIKIPAGMNKIAVTLSVGGGGKGKVQASTDTIPVIDAITGIIWVDWDKGEVAVDSQDSCEPAISALRLNQTFAGTTKLTVRCQ